LLQPPKPEEEIGAYQTDPEVAVVEFVPDVSFSPPTQYRLPTVETQEGASIAMGYGVVGDQAPTPEGERVAK
jgi:hypothetical protein